MSLLNVDYLHLFLKEKLFITEKFEANTMPVKAEDLPEINVTAVKKEFQFAETGGFQKKILIVLPFSSLKSENDLDFLFRILIACQLSENDWKIIEIKPEETDFLGLVEKFSPAISVFFGNFGEIFFGKKDIFPYFMQKIGSNLLLAAEELSILSASPEKKKRLWQTLQLVPFHTF
jgi:hypothetical protein